MVGASDSNIALRGKEPHCSLDQSFTYRTSTVENQCFAFRLPLRAPWGRLAGLLEDTPFLEHKRGGLKGIPALVGAGSP